MSTELVKMEQGQIQTSDIEQVLIGGDLSKLTSEQRIRYVQKLCYDLGLNPLTRPFEFMTLNQRLVLYANKGCGEQLRSIHKISVTITSREQIGDVYVVTARAKKPDGREDESTGAVNVAGMKGEMLANIMMKGETKAKRRVTLSICGLNMLDETEVESVPGVKTESTLNEKYGVNKEVVPPPVVVADKAPSPTVVQAVPVVNSTIVLSPGDFNGPDSFPGDDLGNFVIKVGKLHKGKTFNELGKEKLEGFARASFEWFKKEKKTPSSDWDEFFAKADEFCFGPLPVGPDNAA